MKNSRNALDHVRASLFRGAGIRLEFLLDPHAWRGRLISAGARGAPVHAGSFLRERRIVLDSSLRDEATELRRILLHELFHFAWVRLGNPPRHHYESILRYELERRAKGEMGWSAEWRKLELCRDDAAKRSRRWREYCCESFCDSGAAIEAGCEDHDELTLGKRFRRLRERWFGELLYAGPLKV